jgi:hypothetical protein
MEPSPEVKFEEEGTAGLSGSGAEWSRQFKLQVESWKATYAALDEGIREAAAELQKGAFDFHVHCDPSMIMRSVDAFEVAEGCSAAGMGGIIIKDHHLPMEAVAWLARKYANIRDDFEVHGSTWLNNHVGGWNIYAVDNAIAFGARLIAAGTVSVSNDIAIRSKRAHKTQPPDPSLIKVTQMAESLHPVETLDEDGNVLPEVIECLERIAEAGNVIFGTGHLSNHEVFTVVREARHRGVERINMTHIRVNDETPPEAWRAFCNETGAKAEVTPVKLRVDRLAEFADMVRRVGVEHVTFATDAGFVLTPKPFDYYRMGLGFLLAGGLTEDEVAMVAQSNQRELLGLPVRATVTA